MFGAAMETPCCTIPKLDYTEVDYTECNNSMQSRLYRSLTRCTFHPKQRKSYINQYIFDWMNLTIAHGTARSHVFSYLA